MNNLVAFILAYLATGLLMSDLIAPFMLAIYTRQYRKQWHMDQEKYMKFLTDHCEKQNDMLKNVNRFQLFRDKLKIILLWPVVLPIRFTVSMNRRFNEIRDWNQRNDDNPTI